jgi:tetratricopeptide (TPR) repeat protein
LKPETFNNNQNMKTLTLILAFALSLTANATDNKYIEAMAKNIETVYTAQTIDELQKAVNAFDRIANAEVEKWEPLYYSAFGNVMIANRETDGSKKDGYLDLALASLAKAKSIKPNDSEITALEGFVHMIRITVNPGARGQEFSGKAYESYQKALAFNPNNPRALALMAQMEFGTAQFFKSPTTSACATNSKAIEKFETTKPESPLSPMWGKGMTEGLRSKCK